MERGPSKLEDYDGGIAATEAVQELEDADGQCLTGAEQRAPIGGLLSGGVDGAWHSNRQGSLDSCPVEDLNVVAFQVLGQWHLDLFSVFTSKHLESLESLVNPWLRQGFAGDAECGRVRTAVVMTAANCDVPAI